MQERMKNKIHYSAEARRDWDDIWNYIENDLCNSAAAQRIVNRIMDAVDQLKDFSGLGSSLSSITDTDTDYRYLVTSNYMTFYRVVGNDVYVDRILCGRRNYLHILFGDTIEAEPQQ